MKKIYALLTIIVCLITLTACSKESGIVGTWHRVDNENDTMSFYEDGTCLDVPIKTLTSADPVSYKIQDDGTIILTMEWDGTKVLEKTDDEDIALDDRDYYYLSNDKLILAKKEYVRE